MSRRVKVQRGGKIRVVIRSIYALGATDDLRRQFASGKNLELTVGRGTTVGELLQQFPSLGPPESFDDMQVHVFVNGRQQPFDAVLQPGDVIDVHLPSSGG